MSTNPKLHEILAVEQSLAESANHVTKDVVKNLSEHRSMYEGMTKTHTVFSDSLQLNDQ